MRFPIARSLALATLVPALLLFVFVPGCAKQSEGERCGNDTYGVDNGDCGDGLICVPAKPLLNNAANRCCYADGHVTDSRCELGAPSTPSAGGSGGGSGSGGGNAGGGSAGVSEGGSSGEAGSVSEGGSSGEAGSVNEGGSSGEAGAVSVAGGTGGVATGGAGTGGTSGAGTGGGR